MGDTEIEVVLLAFALLQEASNADFHAVDAGRGLREHAGRFEHHKARALLIENG
jgi:hypothetical protein